jgi:hypothetical protein
MYITITYHQLSIERRRITILSYLKNMPLGADIVKQWLLTLMVQQNISMKSVDYSSQRELAVTTLNYATIYIGVIGYPSFYYGTAEDFRNVRTSPPPSLNELRSVSSAADMIDFLSERFGIESTTTNNNHGTDHTMPPNNDINQTTAPAYTLDVAAYLSDIEKSTSDTTSTCKFTSNLPESSERCIY